MKGFFAGTIVGFVIVAVGMAVVSEIAPMPAARPAPAVAPTDRIAPAGDTGAGALRPGTGPATEIRPVVAGSSAIDPAVTRPTRPEAGAVRAETPAASPVSADRPDPIMDPLPDAEGIADARDAPAAATPAVVASALPGPAAPPAATAARVEPSIDMTVAPRRPAPDPVDAPASEPDPVIVKTQAPPPPPAAAIPRAPGGGSGDATAKVPVVTGSTTPRAAPPLDGIAPDPDAPKVADADAPAVTAPSATVPPSPDRLIVLPVPATPPARGVAAYPPASEAPTPGPAPTPGLDGSVDGVTVGRLPRIGAADPSPDPVAGPVVVPATLAGYSRSFDNPEGRPAFAIVLIDQGLPEADRSRLAALPFPVTFALDPTMPAATEAAAAYRAAGQEVAMLATGIPAGATAGDIEVTFAAHARALPDAVAVLDLETGGFQASRPLATLVVPVIGGQRRGVVTWSGGLNAGTQVALRDGVASGTVFRRFDPDDASVPTMRRNLDRAAFKAAQEGRVIVVGNARADLIPALLAWTLEGRAASVALAPVSAVLTRPGV